MVQCLIFGSLYFPLCEMKWLSKWKRKWYMIKIKSSTRFNNAFNKPHTVPNSLPLCYHPEFNFWSSSFVKWATAPFRVHTSTNPANACCGCGCVIYTRLTWHAHKVMMGGWRLGELITKCSPHIYEQTLVCMSLLMHAPHTCVRCLFAWACALEKTSLFSNYRLSRSNREQEMCTEQYSLCPERMGQSGSNAVSSHIVNHVIVTGLTEKKRDTHSCLPSLQVLMLLVSGFSHSRRSPDSLMSGRDLSQ